MTRNSQPRSREWKLVTEFEGAQHESFFSTRRAALTYAKKLAERGHKLVRVSHYLDANY
jgi:alkylhydroperoxidase family enzyme